MDKGKAVAILCKDIMLKMLIVIDCIEWK